MAGLVLIVCLACVQPMAQGKGASGMSFELSSPAFTHGSEIPARYTCEGKDVSPPLAWSGAPTGTQSLALVVDDPDAPDPAAPKMIWVHWVLYNIPPGVTALPEGADIPAGALAGHNDWKRTRYGGPCPPIGRHRYRFKLYALDAVLPDLGVPSAASLEARLHNHVLAQSELVGTYRKQR